MDTVEPHFLLPSTSSLPEEGLFCVLSMGSDPQCTEKCSDPSSLLPFVSMDFFLGRKTYSPILTLVSNAFVLTLVTPQDSGPRTYTLSVA